MAAKKSSRKRKGSDAKAAKAKAKENHEFVTEAEEILERMFEDLSDLEEQRHGRGEINPDLVNQIFRSAHSLKGLAGMFGLDAIGDLAHRLEDILDGLRLGRVSFDSPAVGLLDEGVALLETLMTQLEQGEGAEGEDAQAFIAQIDAAIEAPAPQVADELGGLEIDPSLLRALTEYEEHRLRENIRRGRHVALVDSIFAISAFEEGLSELSSAVREVGEVVSTLPSPGDAPESQIRFSLLVATEIDADQLRERLDYPDTNVQSAWDATSHSVTSSGVDDGAQSTANPSAGGEAAVRGESDESSSRESSITESPQSASSSSKSTGQEPPEIESLRSISETVRVDIRKLDELMNLVGELVIQSNAISGIATRLEADSQTAKVGVELAKTSKALDRKLKSVLGMREVAQQVRRTTEDHARRFGRIRGNVDELRNAVGRITGTLGQQSEACGQMSELLVKVPEETRTHEAAAGQIKAATRELIAHSDSLREESERFRV